MYLHRCLTEVYPNIKINHVCFGNQFIVIGAVKTPLCQALAFGLFVITCGKVYTRIYVPEMGRKNTASSLRNTK